MKEYKYDYTIFPDNSPEKFKETCKRIENELTITKKKELLIDVDGSTIQSYYSDDKKIVVYDDYDVGVVYVLSDIDLKDIVDAWKSHK